MCAHLKGACSACLRRAPGTRAPGGIPGLKEPEEAALTPSRSQLEEMPEKNPTPGTTSSGDATPAPHSFNQRDHPNHSPRGTPRCIPGYRCPFPLSPRHGLPCEFPLHPGLGSTQNRKTNRNSLTSLSSRLGSATPPAAAATWAASRGSALPAALGQSSTEGRPLPAPPAAGCGAARAEWWQRLPQLPARLSVCFRRRPPPAQLPSASTIGHPPPGAGH